MLIKEFEVKFKVNPSKKIAPPKSFAWFKINTEFSIVVKELLIDIPHPY